MSVLDRSDTGCYCHAWNANGNVTLWPNRARKLLEAAHQCNIHGCCCPRCHPGCHTHIKASAKAKPIRLSPIRLLETSYFPNSLHPVPRNLPHSTISRISKGAQRQSEEEAWQRHKASLRARDGHNPYQTCVCDIVGLDEYFQVVRDPHTLMDYAHRGSCLSYPDPEGWDEELPVTAMHPEMLYLIRQFRHDGRSKKGRKKYTQKALIELQRQCGVRGVFDAPMLRLAELYCRCAVSNFRSGSLGEQKCGICDKVFCCRCCSPTCYGLPKDASCATKCLSCGHCCPQCKPDCPSRQHDFSPYSIGVKPPSSMNHTQPCLDEECQPVEWGKDIHSWGRKPLTTSAVLSPTQSKVLAVTDHGPQPLSSARHANAKSLDAGYRELEFPATQSRKGSVKRKGRTAVPLSTEFVADEDLEDGGGQHVKDLPLKRKRKSAPHIAVDPFIGLDLDRENWPVSYDPTTIAADILRVAGIHPSLPPLNAFLGHLADSKVMTGGRKRGKRRKTEP